MDGPGPGSGPGRGTAGSWVPAGFDEPAMQFWGNTIVVEFGMETKKKIERGKKNEDEWETPIKTPVRLACSDDVNHACTMYFRLTKTIAISDQNTGGFKI